MLTTVADFAAPWQAAGVPLETLTWVDFGRSCRDLARRIHTDGYRPDLILAIARGGLFPAGGLGYALDVKNLHVINVEFYTGVDERLPMPVVLPPVPQLVDLSGARVLIADDVADTGATLRLVKDFCAQHVAEVRCAVIYEKPRSIVKCEYVWRRTGLWDRLPLVGRGPRCMSSATSFTVNGRWPARPTGSTRCCGTWRATHTGGRRSAASGG